MIDPLDEVENVEMPNAILKRLYETLLYALKICLVLVLLFIIFFYYINNSYAR